MFISPKHFKSRTTIFHKLSAVKYLLIWAAVCDLLLHFLNDSFIHKEKGLMFSL